MSRQTRETLKKYFETKDRPTQGQFSDLIDSFVHKTDDDIESLVNWKGTWLVDFSYEVGDFVFSNGSTYICTDSHTSDVDSEAGVGDDWELYWDIFVSQGAQGIQGIQGIQGLPGETLDLSTFTTDDLAQGITNKYFPGFTSLNDDYGFNPSDYVPYTGATTNLDLGNNNLTVAAAGQARFDGGIYDSTPVLSISPILRTLNDQAGSSIFDWSANIGIGAINSGVGNILEVIGASYFSGNIGFGTPSTTYAYDFYNSLRSLNSDSVGGFRITDTGNTNGGFYLYASDDTALVGGIYNNGGNGAILRLNKSDGAELVYIDPQQDTNSGNNFFANGGLVLNAVTGDPTNYKGLYVASGQSYFADSVVMNTGLTVNGTFSPSSITTNELLIRGGIANPAGMNDGYIEINRETASTKKGIIFGENGLGYASIGLKYPSIDILQIDATNSQSTNFGFEILPKGTGTIKLGALAGLIKGTAGVLSAATADTDYQLPYLTRTSTLLTTKTAGDWLAINNTTGGLPLSVTAATDYALPTTNTRQGTFAIGNTTNAYGLIMGVSTASGKAWISSQRFSGGAANYPLLLNPLGSYLVIGGDTGISTAEGSITLAKSTAGLFIESGGLANGDTELTGTYLKIGQSNTTGYNGYLYFKSDNSLGAQLYWGKTSGAGISFANATFIPTINYGFGLGDPGFHWQSFYSAKLMDNGTNVGMLDVVTPFDVGTGRGLHIKSDQLATLLLQGYYKDGTTTSYNSQISLYYSATSQSRILYAPGAATFEINNEYQGTDSTHSYGNIKFGVKKAGGSTITYPWQIKGYDGNLLADEGVNLQFGTTTGTKIGTAATQKLGFYGVTPIVQPTALTAADSSTIDATYGTDEANVITNLRTRVNELETKLRALGLVA